VITCRRAAELISGELDTVLPLHQRAGLAFHAVVCGACRQFRWQLGVVNETVEEFFATAWAGDPDAILPAETKDHLRAVIAAHLEENS